MELADKLVLITGAAGGIGSSTADEFAKAGCQLILTDIDADALEGTAAELRDKYGVRVETYSYDVSDRAQVEEMVASVLDKHGRLDVLINNAGVGHHGQLTETSLETWKRLVDVNLWGPLYHIYAILPSMKSARSGQIVNVSSGQSFFRLPTWGAYAAVKAGVGAFSEILHFELRKYGILVTTVYPFLVDTPFYRGIEGDTMMGKLSMKLMPLYSMKPDTVGKIIFKAVKNKRRVEMVSILNDVAKVGQSLPLVPDVVAMITDRLLAPRPGSEGRDG